MKGQDELFQLIRSLTSSEKRYFKVNGDAKSNYMQLFEAIDAQKETYDEEKLKKKHAKKPFVKYLSAEKKQLREHIMKYMRAYRADATIDNKINELLQDEAFLRDKGLNDQREKVILKAKELATKYERFHLLGAILAKQLAYIVEFEKKKLTEPVINLINEQKQLALIQETELELQTKNRELFSMHRSGSDVQDPTINSRVVMLMSEIERYRFRIGDSFTLGTKFYRGLSNYHQIQRDWPSSFEQTKLEYELYQAKPHFKEEDPYNYKICLANLMSRASAAKEHDWFIKALNEMKNLPTNSFNEEGEVFQNIYFQEHLYYINAGEFEKAEALIPEIEAGLIKYEAKINQARKLAFQFNIMVMYFIMHEFKKALKWCDILMADSSEIKQDQKFVAVLLLPIIHFELGHEELVENYTRSAYRQLQSKKRLHEFEKLIVKYLKSMPLSSDQTEFKEKLSEFHTKLDALIKNPELKISLGMEEVSLWAKSKLTGRMMSKLISSQ